MRNDKISVIIAIYNVAEYLEQCLESVRHQTYKNLEIICVDDGSVDGSAEICDRYAVADSRFIVIHKENGGECSARNFGLNICSGSYISFIDGDDWLEPRMYERLLELILQDEKIGISMCGHSMDYEDRTVMMINNKKVPEKIVSPMREFLY